MAEVREMNNFDEVEIHLSGGDVSGGGPTKCRILGRVEHFDDQVVTVCFIRPVGEWEIRAPRRWFLSLPEHRWLLELT